MRTEKRSSPQISGDMVLLHKMVSPQNGDTRGGPPPPSDATDVDQNENFSGQNQVRFPAQI